MFEAAEVGHKLSKAQFEKRVPELRMGLVQAQQDAAAAGRPIIILVAGVEGAGRSLLVNQLTGWLDARTVNTVSFWQLTDQEAARPWAWRYWQQLPPGGRTGVLFGGWYTDPINGRGFEELDEASFERRLHQIADFERTISDGGAILVKLWLHLSADAQKRRHKESKKKNWTVSPMAKKYAKHYERMMAATERAIRITDTGACPWHVVESTDPLYRDITAAELILETTRRALDHAAEKPSRPSGDPSAEAGHTILDTVDLSAKLTKKGYRSRLAAAQTRLQALGWELYQQRIATVCAFEGWDAGGKGGAIRRLISPIDARLYRVVRIAAPEGEAKLQHYLWRFWREIPADGMVRIFDRSWYGRVLVERVEGFATETEWRRSFGEINAFEDHLIDHGIVLCKFWLHISKEEQLRRFEERQATPWKQFKITDEDWRNREKWGAYEAAVNEMVDRTSTHDAPWTLVAGDDKRHARVQVLETVIERMEAALESRGKRKKDARSRKKAPGKKAGK
ncbi:MAG: polyphosphate:AMP phosphotransferase [Deltaproteobacteria bacterium]|nr:polyphosphate:AMP phosphotransferase [Deltaproteobacteria bacterium]